jgi:hypothetical protein
MKAISIAAGAVLLFATASSFAYAQSTTNVACNTPGVASAAAQKAGEGESAGKAQNAGEGESAGKAQNAGEGESAGKAQNAGEGESAGKAQNAAATMPCKG